MARLSFFRGAVTGRLGEFVGSKWKGINYLRLHANPANPRTPGQISIRLVFKALSNFASALFSLGWLEYIPPAARMTERNSVFKANKQMLTTKTFVPAALQVAKSNLQVIVKNFGVNFDANGPVFMLAARVEIPDIEQRTGKTLHAFIYDHVRGIQIASAEIPITIGVNGYSIIDAELDPPPLFNTPDGSQKADCRVFIFITGETGNGDKLISQTFNAALV